MSQHDYNIANASGAVVRADVNDVLDAIATQNSGSSAPSVTFANMWWFDTANNLLKQRDNANSSWITVAAKDGSGWRPYWNGSPIADQFLADSVSATSRVLGRKTAGAGAVEELTLSEVLDFIGSAAEGDILYRASGAWARLAKGTNGQVLKLASGIPSWADEAGGTFTWLSESTGGGGTSIDVTGIGSGAKEVVILFQAVNVDADLYFLLQLGDSGGVEATGYVGSSFNHNDTQTDTIGFPVRRGASNVTGTMTLHNPTGNLWMQKHGQNQGSGGGSKTLSGTLTRIRLQRASSGNFQSGTVYVGYR